MGEKEIEYSHVTNTLGFLTLGIGAISALAAVWGVSGLVLYSYFDLTPEYKVAQQATDWGIAGLLATLGFGIAFSASIQKDAGRTLGKGNKTSAGGILDIID